MVTSSVAFTTGPLLELKRGCMFSFWRTPTAPEETCVVDLVGYTEFNVTGQQATRREVVARCFLADSMDLHPMMIPVSQLRKLDVDAHLKKGAYKGPWPSKPQSKITFRRASVRFSIPYTARHVTGHNNHHNPTQHTSHAGQ